MGLYEMYVLAARVDTALMRRIVAEIMNRRRKKQYLHNQKKNLNLGIEMNRGADLRLGKDSINIYLRNSQLGNI